MAQPDQTSGICHESVYAHFFNSQVKTLRNYLYYKFGDQEMANDAAQEAFLKLWQNCSDVPASKAKAFTYKIAVNLILNKIKHTKVVRQYSNNTTSFKLEFESPDYIMEEQQFNEKLQNAINNLTESQRTAFLLNRIEGKKYAEIAEILNIGVKAVEKRIHGALVALRKEIEEMR